MAWRDCMDARLIIVASTNPGKIREVRLALGDLQGWAVEPLPPGIHGIEETGGSFIENAIQKAEHYSRFVEGLTLGDDSGLCVHALHDAPGLHSARYGPTPEARNQRVLSELEAISAADRNATFICAFALARAGTVVWKTEARLAGRIAHEPAGAFGFGYDPIFDVPELGKTLAELPPEEKNRTSARGRALVELRRFLAGV